MIPGFGRVGTAAFRNYTIHNNSIAKSLERLSTGKRINRAADDPAGLAVSERLKLRLTLLDTDRNKVQDAMSKIDIADGIMGEMNSMLNRMMELASQAACGTYSDSERQAMDAEYQQLLDEINRSGKSEHFMSETLFAKEGTSTEGLKESVTLQGNNLGAFLDGLDRLLTDISTAAKAEDGEKLLSLGIDINNGKTDGENLREAINQFTKDKGQELLNTPSGKDGGSQGEFEIILSDGTITIQMSQIDDKTLGLTGTGVGTQEDARKAMDAVKKAISNLSASRGSLGASYNRLEHTLNNISTMEVNLTDALSRIEDVDMAKEMMNLVKEQVLAQASVFAIAQANQQPKQILALLKTES